MNHISVYKRMQKFEHIRNLQKIKYKNYRNTESVINLFFCCFYKYFHFLIPFHTRDSSINDSFSERYPSIIFVELVISRIRHNSNKETRLALCKICCVFVEVILCSLFDSIYSISEFYNIDIDFHNSFFTP